MKAIFATLIIFCLGCSPVPLKRVVVPHGWSIGSDTLVLVPLDRFRLLLDSATAAKLNFEDCSKKVKK
jgi:hypothetical protein